MNISLFHIPEPPHLFWKGSQRPQTHKLLSTLSTASTSWINETWRNIMKKKKLKEMVRNLIHLICMNWSCRILQGSASSPRQLILFGGMASLCYYTPSFSICFYFITFQTIWNTLMGGSISSLLQSDVLDVKEDIPNLRGLGAAISCGGLEKSVWTHLS